MPSAPIPLRQVVPHSRHPRFPLSSSPPPSVVIPAQAGIQGSPGRWKQSRERFPERAGAAAPAPLLALDPRLRGDDGGVLVPAGQMPTPSRPLREGRARKAGQSRKDWPARTGNVGDLPVYPRRCVTNPTPAPLFLPRTGARVSRDSTFPPRGVHAPQRKSGRIRHLVAQPLG